MSLEESTQRVSAQEIEDAAEGRTPLAERPLSTIFERVFQFHWFSHEEGSSAAIVHAEAMHERLETDGDDVREFWRAEASGLAELGVPEALQAGRLVDIGGGGLCVSTARPLEVGAFTEARLTDEEGGWAYEFPCVVVWAEGAPDPKAGLRFDGRPRRIRLD